MATPLDGGDSLDQLATIKVMSPAPQLTINFVLPLDLTIRELKDRITESLESKPDHTHQRLIYRGKFLQDGQSIGSVLKASANGEDPEVSDSYTFHLALRPLGTTPTTPLDRSLSSSAPILSATPSQNDILTTSPPLTGETRTTALERQRQSIQEAIGNVRQRLDRLNNLTSLASPTTSSSPSPAVVTRVETRIDYSPREGSNGIPRVMRTTTTRMTASVRVTSRGMSNASGPTSVFSPRTSSSSSPPVATITEPPTSSTSIFSMPTASDINTVIASLQTGTNPPPSLYLLQGPEGQCLLLSGPPRSTTYSTFTTSENHPVIQRVGIHGYLPGESPTDAPISSSDPSLQLEYLLQNLGIPPYELPSQHVGNASGDRRANGTGFAVQELLVRELGRLQALRDRLQQFQQHQQQHGHNHPQQQQQARQQVRQINMADILRRIQEGGTHVWLAVRLVIFVVLFSGGASWRRRVMLGALALVIFVWQTGILDTQFAAVRALYRELFPQMPQPAPPQPVSPINPRTPLDPSATAEMLVRRQNLRRRTRAREAYESVERVVTLFVASLIPGMHERHVRAHEERERAAAAAATASSPAVQAEGGQGQREDDAVRRGDGNMGDGAEQRQRRDPQEGLLAPRL